jgi:hypothetical protein
MVAYTPASSTAESARSMKRATGYLAQRGFAPVPVPVAESFG